MVPGTRYWYQFLVPGTAAGTGYKEVPGTAAVCWTLGKALACRAYSVAARVVPGTGGRR